MFFFFKQKTAYEMRISYWSSDVCSSDLPLLFRYFASKNALIERVHQEVFIGRWNPYWEIVISHRNVPLRERLVNVYQALAQPVLNSEWVRLFMFAGLKGSDINGRWYSFIQEHRVRSVCAEFSHDIGLPTLVGRHTKQGRANG